MPDVVVTIREAPSGRVAEKLRMAVGLTLVDDNRVSALLIGDGVWAGLGTDPERSGLEIDKHLETLSVLGAKILAHAPSAEARGVVYGKFGVGMLSDEQVSSLLKAENTVIV